MANLTELLGKAFDGKESLSLEDVSKAITESGAKFTDIKDGGYVDKEKFDKQESKRKDEITKLNESVETLTKERDDLKGKASGDDGLTGQVTELTKRLEAAESKAADSDAKALKAEHAAAVSEKVSDARFARLALIDAEGLVNDDTDFKAALAKVLEDNPDYTEPGTTVKVKSGEKVEGKPDPAATAALEAFEKGVKAGEPKKAG